MEDNQDQNPQAALAAQTAQENALVQERDNSKKIIETLLFITDRPLSLARLSQVSEVNDAVLTRDIVEELRRDYAAASGAVQILEIGGGFQMATKPEYGRWVRKLFNEKMSSRLSPAALETLAIIAYKQPVTRAEIEAIRGVDVAAPLERILERGLARITGKKDTPGRPMVYGTTEEFLRMFGLNKISELPDIASFAGKGLKEVQSDLPFSEALPDIKENIIPLTDEEALLHNYPRPAAQEETEEIPEELAPAPVPVPAHAPGPETEAAEENHHETVEDSMARIDELKD
ncbi:MAG: SMC-Scp complex subunit ScpB [Elusimicrobiota bacterium]|jgi:segregation and condensation protein B|nr:SMC-Scp complex subunit ScpB [Elusimicrobiota bacterium]